MRVQLVIETKLHVELLWDLEFKVCASVLGHKTKMAAMPIYMYTCTVKPL